MNNVTLFAIGMIVFILLTWATLMFLYLRFNNVYRRDQAQAEGGPETFVDGNLEVLSAPERNDS
jgi:hypothetical protein